MVRPAILGLLVLSFAACALAGPLADYVNAPNPAFNWVNMNHTYEWPYATGYLLNLTSQEWLTPADSSQPIWWHYMVVVVPKTPKFKDSALLWITGGHNYDGIPDITSQDLKVSSDIANVTNTVVVALFQIPNEPISFPTDPAHPGLTEDGLIAFTWAHFINYTNEPNWLLRLPMTKACVAAMNATEEFVMQQNGMNITRWLAAGASKRGWTTWTLGAVEAGKRIVGIIPIVMDALNLVKNMHHMWRNFGGWTFLFSDYYGQGLTGMIDLPQFQEMCDIIDPYSYLDQLALIPKLVIDAGDDEFFQPDDNWYWWDNMTGEKHLVMLPDAEHSLITAIPEVLQAVGTFVDGVLTGTPRPNFNWTMDLEAGTITVVEEGTVRATKATLHWAENLTDKRRDFRWLTAADAPGGKCAYPTIPVPKHEGVCLAPILWAWEELKPEANGTYVARRPIPTNGHWEAFFVTLHYVSPLTFEEYIFTTQIAITPNTYPFPPCVGEGCKGTLV
jgi:PhoPQ-activated pathogenicity-related protein